MITICIVNQKGGVGKTASAAAIGAGLHRAGQRVLYIDLDPQSNLSLQLNASQGATVYDVLTGSATAAAAIHSSSQGDIIPADRRLSSKGTLTGKGAEYRLKDALQPIQRSYTACLIDCPPSLGALTVAALTAADGVIIPCKADRFSLDALHEISGTLDAIRASSNQALKVYGVLITQYNGRTSAHRLLLDEIKELAAAHNMPVYEPPIRRAIAVEETQITGGTVYDTRNGAAEDYTQITGAVLKQIKKDGGRR